MKYIKGLDAVRTFAIIIVILSHWGPHSIKHSQALTFFIEKILPKGLFGVDLFFVLSGYLITKILLENRERTDDTQRVSLIKNFYIRRMLRIFPIYYLFILISAFVLNDEYIRTNIVSFLTYTTNFLPMRDGAFFTTHTWSLAAEEQFYLIWPWVIIFSPKKYLFHIILATLGIGLVSTWGLNYLYGPYATYLLLPCITAFAIGALYAYVSLYPAHKKIVVNGFYVLLPMCVVLLLVHQFGHPLAFIRVINAVIAICIIIYVSAEKYNTATGFILTNRLIINVGKISYGLYLYHLTLPKHYYRLMDYVKAHVQLSPKMLKLLMGPPGAYLIHLLILFIVAILSYRYFELYFLKLKRFVSYTGYKRQATVNPELVK